MLAQRMNSSMGDLNVWTDLEDEVLECLNNGIENGYNYEVREGCRYQLAAELMEQTDQFDNYTKERIALAIARARNQIS